VQHDQLAYKAGSLSRRPVSLLFGGRREAHARLRPLVRTSAGKEEEIKIVEGDSPGERVLTGNLLKLSRNLEVKP